MLVHSLGLVKCRVLRLTPAGYIIASKCHSLLSFDETTKTSVCNNQNYFNALPIYIYIYILPYIINNVVNDNKFVYKDSGNHAFNFMIVQLCFPGKCRREIIYQQI